MEEEKQPLRNAYTTGVLVVFVTVTLGVCALFVFIYNLPRIFPPVGGTRTTVGAATLVPGWNPLITPMPTPTQFAAFVTETARPQPTLLAQATSVPPTAAPTVTRPAATATAVPATPVPPTPIPPTLVPPSATPPPVQPTTAPATGRIIFVADANGSSIFVMNADGSGQRLLVPHKGDYADHAPAISPDGRRLAFASTRDKPGRDNIYVVNIDGGRLDQITDIKNADNHSPSWFPDGQHLAFTSNRNKRWQVYTMRDDGRNVDRLFDSDEDVLTVAVAPDGTTLAYTCGDELCLANADGSKRRTLVKNGSQKDHLVWSPASDQIAYSQRTTDGVSVYVTDLSGSTRQVLQNATVAAWSPDGQRLVFSSDRDGAPALYTFDLTTAEVRRLTGTRAARSLSVWVP